MSTTPLNDGPHPDLSPGSMQTLVSRPLLPQSDPITTKRVCFYKSGDPQFTGHRMVINSRTFKTFDALLDALSKKVPLPFGVRTITTPRGTHAVCSLDDVQDGGSYLCSDQKKVKPFNLDEVHKRQVPWNTTRPVSAGRQARRELVRQLAKRNQVSTRTIKMSENTVVVRTPKRLTVYKNRDPSMKRVIVLHRRIAPTFEALLDYLSQTLQFPVVKLYTEDGRRVEGLSALILYTGIVVAAGNEPFRIGIYNLQAPTKIQSKIPSESESLHQTETLLQEKKIPSGTNSRSRNFSLSSERFLVEQINKSLNGNLTEHNGTKDESMETEGSQPVGSDEMEACDFTEDVKERNCPIMPNEDDIEKSFRVNEDGSMTVEMKVHLTIKQEEMIHWTTTLSRTSVNSQQRAVCNSKPESGANSVDITNDSGKESNGPHSLDSKEINTAPNKSVGFIKEERENYGSDTSSEKPMPVYRRLPTPAPRQRRNEVSVENIKTVSEAEVQESTVGAYSYMERTAQGELMEGYCVVSRSSSSSTRTVSKPGKSESGEIKQKKSHSSFRSSGVAEVLQLQNNGTMGITETVVHIYESQGTCDNYYANTQMDTDNKPGYCTKALPQSKPGSTDSGPCSSSNDCDVDLTRQSTSSNSLDGGKSKMLSLSSDRSTPPKKINSNLSILTDDEKQSLVECTSETIQKKIMHPAAETNSTYKSTAVNKNNLPKSKKSKQSTSSGSSRLGKNIKGSAPGSSKDLQVTSDTMSHTGSEKKTSSAESDKHEHKAVRDKNKKTKIFESSSKSKNLNLENGNQRPSDKDVKLKDKTIKDSSHKINTNSQDSQGSKLKKSSLDIESPAHAAKLIKRLPKQRSMNGVRSKSSKPRQELSESVSLPVLQSSSTSVNQYVENWLKRIEPESLPYEDETDPPEIVPRAVFQIGADSTEDSEIKSIPDRDSTDEKEQLLEDYVDESPMSHPPVQIRCEGEPIEPQKTMGFCKSMPILRVPSEQEGIVRMHKSSEHLFPPEPSGTSQSTEVSIRSGMKPVLQQLCLSVQSIKRALSQTCLTSGEREKSSSLPDFSSQVASAFGSPSRALLSFLSVMTLRDGLSVLYKNESETGSSNDCPEALQVMQSLEKLSNIKDEDELRASLTSLRSSTSSKLNQSWKDFQEQNIYNDSPPLSPRLSEQEFALEVDLEGDMGDQDKQHSIAQLLDELNMPEDVQREISSLVEGELKYFTQSESIKDAENITEMSGKEEENDDGSLGGSLEKAAEMEEERDNIGQDNDAANEDITNDPKDPEPSEIHLNQSHSPDSETVENDFLNEDSGIAVPNQSPEGNGSDSSKAEALKMSNNNQVNAESLQEKVMYEDLESENKDAEGNHSSIAEDDFQDQKMTAEDVAEGEDVSELSDDQGNMSEREENIIAEDTETDEKENDTIQDMRQTSEQSDDSEPDAFGAKHSCSASESECMSFSDREAAEVNEDNHYNTAEDCVKEEEEEEEEEETINDRGQEQENKSILSEGESLPLEPSETSSPHHDTEGEFKEQTIQSSSQEDDQVMSPDIKDADEQVCTTSEVSEDEDSEPHFNNSSPHHGSNVENSMTPETDYEKSQHIEDDLVEEHDINKVDHDGSEVCKQLDPDAEPDSSTISDPEVGDEDVAEKKSNTSDSKLQTLEEDSLIDKKGSSAEECDEEEVDHSSLLDSHNNIDGVQNSIVCTNTTDSAERESCSSTITSGHHFENTESLGMEHGYHYLLQPTEISQELLDLINSALLSSTLTVTSDSNGNLRIEPDKCKMKEMFMAGQRTDDQYGQKRLPSPNTSDLSDYRPETSDIGGYQSQEFFTESGDEETERLHIFREILKQSSEKPRLRNHVKENSSMKSPTWMATKHTGSPSLKSSGLNSFRDTNSAINEPLSHSVSPSNKSSLDGDAESVQGMTLKDKINSEEGVLIDKGRWLLKENHLIRNSPPASMGMYGNEDTTSADTAQDNRSEDSSHPYCENQASPLAAISSSELEDMVKPPTPKCTYFNMAHSSDSDPLIDAQSVRSGSGGGDTRRKRELKVCPMGESSNMWAKKNGSMSSFASVEFKLPDGKVHPQKGSSSGVHRSQSQDSQIVQEEESRVGLNLRCGQHCPIL
ncbi:oxygen-regulated protein 1 [Danio aesculapii]|uniref:oxygen-regulated protein 1 n=1 Tax=Danio aesculapii TaxID=1142201 RepID=UPI0024C097E9|nr:oxygen-regulated protein 1 [Danio aesculapii]